MQAGDTKRNTKVGLCPVGSASIRLSGAGASGRRVDQGRASRPAKQDGIREAGFRMEQDGIHEPGLLLKPNGIHQSGFRIEPDGIHESGFRIEHSTGMIRPGGMAPNGANVG